MIADVIVKKAERKGRGVFALRSFRKGELIFRYKRGRVAGLKDISKLSRDDKEHLNEVDQSAFEIMRVPERYLNHSCDPNAVNKRRSLYALRSVRRGEEITTDYRVNGLWKSRWTCHCGSKNCKGYVISDFFTLPPAKQKLYLPYTLEVIREEYRKRHNKRMNA